MSAIYFSMCHDISDEKIIIFLLNNQILELK